MAPSVAGICVHLSVFCGITFANGMVVQEILGGLCSHQDPQETELDLPLCLSAPCRAADQQWPARGIGTLAAADLGGTACGKSPLGEGYR